MLMTDSDYELLYEEVIDLKSNVASDTESQLMTVYRKICYDTQNLTMMFDPDTFESYEEDLAQEIQEGLQEGQEAIETEIPDRHIKEVELGEDEDSDEAYDVTEPELVMLDYDHQKLTDNLFVDKDYLSLLNF